MILQLGVLVGGPIAGSLTGAGAGVAATTAFGAGILGKLFPPFIPIQLGIQAALSGEKLPTISPGDIAQAATIARQLERQGIQPRIGADPFTGGQFVGREEQFSGPIPGLGLTLLREAAIRKGVADILKKLDLSRAPAPVPSALRPTPTPGAPRTPFPILPAQTAAAVPTGFPTAGFRGAGGGVPGCNVQTLAGRIACNPLRSQFL